MRVKKKKHGAERLEACGDIVIKDLREQGSTSEALFGNSKPLRIEIGCGKGDFIRAKSVQEPNYNYLAIEKISDNKSSIDLFDLYGYDGTKIEADYQKQADDYIYKLIYTNLRDRDLYMKKYIEAKGERFPVRMNYLTERKRLKSDIVN